MAISHISTQELTTPWFSRGFTDLYETQTLNSLTEEESENIVIPLFLKSDVLLCKYWTQRYPLEFRGTDTWLDYQILPISLTETATTDNVFENTEGIHLDIVVGETTNKHISLSEAIALQNQIHQKLKQEIEDGLHAEAQYQKYYDDEDLA